MLTASVLIVEDEKKLSDSVKDYLSNSGFNTVCAASFKEAVNQVGIINFDCVLVDIGLPDGSGIDFIRYLKRKRNDSGLIVISAREQLDTRIEALETGADDFLLKPFHLSELSARINALIRRKKFSGHNTIEYGEIILILPENRVLANGMELNLTRKELELLIYFISNAQKVLTREAISFNIWKNHSDMDISNEIIYTHIKNLRKKIIETGAKDYIKAVYGVGYKFGV